MTTTETLQVTTPSDREIRLTREFNAPRHLVYQAYTKPELLKRWLGCIPGWSWQTCEMDVREGGSYRWVWNHPSGEQMGMGGVYREVVPGERLVTTEKFDQAWYEGDAVGTVEFSEVAGRTTVTTSILYDTKQIRDAVLRSPMKSGMEMGFSLLDELLASSAEAHA